MPLQVRWARALLAAAALATGSGAFGVVGATGQTGCRLVEVGGYTLSARNSLGSRTHYASGGVDYSCTDGVRVRADSAVGFEHSSTLNLYGGVRFEDAEVILEAGQAIYFGQARYLRATHGSRVEYKNTGTVVSGQELDYYRQSDSRLLDEMTVRGGQPHATVYPPPPPEPVEGPTDKELPTPEDTTGAPPPEELQATDPVAPPVEPAPAAEPAPYEIDAERFVVEGRQVFQAVNDVVVLRDSLRATGDTLFYDQESGAMSMHGEPSVGDGRFDLAARWISITPASPGNEEILAGGDAALAGAAVAIEATAIRLFLDGGDLSRLIALATVPAAADAQPDTAGLTPGDQARLAELVRVAEESDTATAAAPDSVPRPAAYAEDLTLVADSIEVLSPGQVLQVVTAVGTARAVAARADSLDEDTPEVARTDWMEGDTIVANFVPPGSRPDGETGPRAAGRSLLETLVSVGNARSLYRVPPDTTLAVDEDEQPTSLPPLHWTQGQRITMYLTDGQVVRMFVEGETLGYHFEPRPPVPADSAAVADSSALADSIAVPALPDSASTAPPPAADTMRTLARRRRP